MLSLYVNIFVFILQTFFKNNIHIKNMFM